MHKNILMKRLTGFFFLLITFLNACKMNTTEADLLIYNGTIYTANNHSGIAGAMYIKSGKIVAIGKLRELEKNFTAKRKIDLKGKYVYPGFYDAHCHFYGYGLNQLTGANLAGTKSFDEVIERVREHHRQHPSYWIQGRGWDQNDWQTKTFPDKSILDSLFPGQPVALRRIDGHALLVNQKALDMAHIDRHTKIPGGEILLKDGKPNGILVDNAMEKVLALIPPPDTNTIREALLLAQKDCFAAGLCSVADAGLEYPVLQQIESLQQEQQLKMRIYAMLSPSQENIEHYVKKGPYTTDRLTVRSIKLYSDGALGSRGAKLKQDYSDRAGTNGLLIHDADYFRRMGKLAIEHGYQVNTHAIGDSANYMLLHIYGELLHGKNDKRWRIEHAQVIDSADFELFGKYSIIPSVQPTHATSDMYWAGERLGKQRLRYAYAYRRLLEQNGYIALGTDFPIEDINPLYTFYAAVARKDLNGYPERGFQKENALSRQDALRGMTIWAAKAAFEENRKGSLETGKAADFVVLDKDIMHIAEDEIPQTTVLFTFVNGEKVFAKNEREKP